jgi:hypothetical protein
MSIVPMENAIIKFTDENNVTVEFKTENGNEVRYISFNDFAQAILAANQQVKFEAIDVVDSPIFTVGHGISTVQTREYSTGSRTVILVREPMPMDITYFDDVYKNVGIPRLLFGIKIYQNIIQSVRIMAIKDFIIKENTPLYEYPFSNVSRGTGNVCFGMNRVSSIDVTHLTALHSIPDMFLSMPNNNDNYGHNLSGLDYRPLLERLSDKPFDDNWLEPAKKTYKEWFEQMK